MSEAKSPSVASKPNRRWFHVTPGHVVVGLLVVEALLWLSERFGWLPWHKGYAVLAIVAVVAAVLVVVMLWFATALLFQWQFQFSIRSLLVLTVAVALPCSWLVVERAEAKRQLETVVAIQDLGGIVSWSTPSEADWLRSLLGENYGMDITDVIAGGTKLTDTELKLLKGLKQLRGLSLGETGVTDAGLDTLKGLKHLQVLNLSQTKVTDAGLEHVKGLDQLQWLNLNETKITDAGLESLKGLNQLQELDLNDTQIGDAGLENLNGMNQLHRLGLTGTQVTAKGVKKLQQALPDCTIIR